MVATRQPDGSVLLNQIAADATNVHLEWARKLPGLAREIADIRVLEAATTQKELDEVKIGNLTEENQQLKNERWSLLDKAALVVGTGVLGVALGIVVGWKVSK